MNNLWKRAGAFTLAATLLTGSAFAIADTTTEDAAASETETAVTDESSENTATKNDLLKAKIINARETGSLSIYKYDTTSATQDGVYDEESEENSTESLGDYAIAGVGFSYLRLGNVETYSNDGNVQLLYEIPSDLAELLGLTDEYDVDCENEGVSHFTSQQLDDAIKNALQSNDVSIKNALEDYVTGNENAVTMPLTDNNGYTNATNLELGLYLVVESSVPEEVVETCNPWFVQLPTTENVAVDSEDNGTESYVTIDAAESDSSSDTETDDTDDTSADTAEDDDADIMFDNSVTKEWVYDITCYPKNQTGVPTLDKGVRNASEGTVKAVSNTTDTQSDTSSESEEIPFAIPSGLKAANQVDIDTKDGSIYDSIGAMYNTWENDYGGTSYLIGIADASSGSETAYEAIRGMTLTLPSDKGSGDIDASSIGLYKYLGESIFSISSSGYMFDGIDTSLLQKVSWDVSGSGSSYTVTFPPDLDENVGGYLIYYERGNTSTDKVTDSTTDTSDDALTATDTATDTGTSTTTDDTNSTTDETAQASGNTYFDTVTASEGDTLDYVLVSKLPVITSKATYLTRYTFVDSMQNTVSYNEDATISLYEAEEDATTNNTANAVCTWTDNEYFTQEYIDSQMTIALTEAGLNEINTKYSEYYIVVNYTAKLLDTAVLGDEGNQNNVSLVWSRTNEDFSNTLEDRCYVYTYGIDLTKTFSDSKGDFSKVEFVLKNTTDGYYVAAESDSNGNYTVTGKAADQKNATTLTPSSEGKLVVEGLEADTYELTETSTDSNYNLPSDAITLEITSTSREITSAAAGYINKTDESGHTHTDDCYAVDDEGNRITFTDTAGEEEEILICGYADADGRTVGKTAMNVGDISSATASVDGETVDMLEYADSENSSVSASAFAPVTVDNERKSIASTIASTVSLPKTGGGRMLLAMAAGLILFVIGYFVKNRKKAK